MDGTTSAVEAPRSKNRRAVRKPPPFLSNTYAMAKGLACRFAPLFIGFEIVRVRGRSAMDGTTSAVEAPRSKNRRAVRKPPPSFSNTYAMAKGRACRSAPRLIGFEIGRGGGS